MGRGKFRAIIFPEMHKNRCKGSKHRASKDYVYNAMKKTGYSFRQISIKAGVETKSQMKVFIQILDVADTYSSIFAPYRSKLRIVVKDYLRHKRDRKSKIHLMKSVSIEGGK